MRATWNTHRRELAARTTTPVMSTIHAWTEASEAPCVRQRAHGCAALRTESALACAAACATLSTCTHANAVVRPRGATWCYLRTGVAVLTPVRCARRAALQSVLEPQAVVLSGTTVTWSPLDDDERRERTNCSVDASQDLVRQVGLPQKHFQGALHRRFRQHCRSAMPRLPVGLTFRLSMLNKAGFSQSRLGPQGNIGRAAAQVACYYELVRSLMRRPLKACEVGFNAGHSAIVLLSAMTDDATNSDERLRGSRFAPKLAAPRASYLGFDLGLLPWTLPAARLINSSTAFFPGAVHLIVGDSARTAPNALRQHARARPCDVLSIDGNHTVGGVIGDWAAFRKGLRPGSLIFLDDVGLGHPVWNIGGMERIGCVSLSGVADDFQRPHPLPAAESFCVAVSTDRQPTQVQVLI